MSHRKVTGVALALGLTIAPVHLATAQCTRDEFVAGGTRTDGFGRSISLDGDVAVIGAHHYGVDFSGAAFVFRRTPAGWVEEDILVLPFIERQFNMNFGQCVAVRGDVIAVGAPELDIQQQFDRGAVYVYRRGPSGFEIEHRIYGLNPNEQLGWTLELEADRLFVGSVGAGVVATYEYDGSSWKPGPVIQSSESGANDRFGYGMALSGSTLLVGAPSASIANEFGAGKVHAFERNGTSWQEVQVLTASDPDWYEFFGDAIAADGDVALIGSSDNDGASFNGGAAYVFRRAQGVWSEEAKLMAGDGADDDHFGESVAIQGDAALVGAPQKKGESPRDGAAYLFRRSTGTGTWHGDRLHPTHTEPGAMFGRALEFLPATPDQLFLLGATFSLYDTDTPGFVTEWRADADEASWSNHGSGWPGTNGVPELTLDAPPWLGAEIEITVGNSSAAPTSGVFLFGHSRDHIVTPFDGTLELRPTMIVAIAIPSTGLSLPLILPLDPTLSGVSVYAQVLQLDPGASKGVSFTPGLGLRFGMCR